MAEIIPLRQAVETCIKDGISIAMEGFTHLIPHAVGHEIIRQKREDLHVIRMTPDIIYDQLIGAGCVNRVTFSWGGNPGVGSLHRFRDAIENKWPQQIEIEEHSHAGMAVRYVAGASGLPFGILRGYVGTDLVSKTSSIKTIECPFTSESLTAVPSINPDVAVIHAQRADRHGNVQLWGLLGVQREAVLAAKASIVTVEEIVDSLPPMPGSIVIPSWVVTAVCCVPNGAHPSYAAGFSERDNSFYKDWDAISSDREVFGAWVDKHIHGSTDFVEYGKSVGISTLQRKFAGAND